MKLIFIIISIILFQTAGYCIESPKDIPEGLYKALFAKLNQGDYLKNALRRFGFDTTITVDEIDPGIPVQFHDFKIKPSNSSLKEIGKIDINAPVMSLIEPNGIWLFCLKAREEYIITLLFDANNDKFQHMSTGGRRKIWEEVWNTYPESTGVRPVAITFGDRGLFHFPHINERNLTFATDENYRKRIKSQIKFGNRSLLRDEDLQELKEYEKIMSKSYDSVSVIDSRITLQVVRNRFINVKKQKALQKQGRLK